MLRYAAAMGLAMVLTGCGSGGGGLLPSPGGKSTTTASTQLYADGVNRFTAGDFTVAATDFQQVVQGYPAASEAAMSTLYLGRAQYELGQYALAEQTLTQAITLITSGNYAADPYYWRGRARHKQGLLDLAREDYAWVINNAATSQWIDNALLQTGNSWFDQANYPGARSWYQQVLAGYPASSSVDDAQYQIGRSYHAELNYAAALAEYRQLAVPNSTSTLADNAHYQIGRVYYDQAVAALAQNQITAAQGLLHQAITQLAGLLSPHTITLYADYSAENDAQYYSARSWHRLAGTVTPVDAVQLQQARALYKSVMAVPGSLLADNAHFQYAMTYYDETNYQTAIVELDTLLSPAVTGYADTSAFDEAYLYRGMARHRLGNSGDNFVLADRDYRMVTDWYGATSIYADNAHYERGKLQYDQQDWAKASTLFELLVKPVTPLPYPDTSAYDQAWYFLGRTYENMGRNVDATAAYNTLIASYPASFYAPLAQARLPLP